MTVTVKHAKTNAISDWTQAQLDEQIALGNFAEGTVLADIVLPSDWNNDHTLTGVGTMAEQNANSVAITGGSVNGTTIGATTPSTSVFTTVGVQTSVNAAGATANINLDLISKGTGNVRLITNGTGAIDFYTNNSVLQSKIIHTASAVNYVQVTGAATGNTPAISAQGSDANINLLLNPKGTGQLNVFINNGSQFRVSNTASAVNYLEAKGNTSSNVPTLSAQGTDTNISMAFQPKGTGAIDLAAGSRGVNISNGGTVTALTRTAGGSGYTTALTATISAPTTAGGVQATANAYAGAITTVITSGGTGYTLNDVITVVGGTGIQSQSYTVTGVTAGVITALTVQNYGQYTAIPSSPVSTTGGTGTGASLTLSNWSLTAIAIATAGSGYIEQPTVTFSGGGGSGASAYATVGSMPIIRSLAGSAATGDSLSFYTPAGESVRIRDQGVTSNGYVQLQGSSATSNGSYVTSSAGSLYISCAGTNAIGMFTNGQGGTRQFNVTHTASAVNYVQVTGNVTTSPPIISAQGSDATVAMLYRTKGNGVNHSFQNGSGNNGLVVTPVTSTANFLQITSSIATAAPSLASAGTDTNIDLSLTPKGTGLVRFGTYVAGALTATGYINIKAADGTTYKVLVST